MKIKKAEFLKLASQPEDFLPGHYPEIALAGRSNVGKSSLLNTLAGQRNLARTSNTPGKTRAVHFYLFNDAFCLVDLPGYGYARVSRTERQKWGPLIEGFLVDRKSVKMILHVVDIRHAPSEEDKQMSAWLHHFEFPALVVATKLDKIPRGRREGQKILIARTLEKDPSEILLFSSKTREGRDKLLKIIVGRLSAAAVEPPG